MTGPYKYTGMDTEFEVEWHESKDKELALLFQVKINVSDFSNSLCSTCHWLKGAMSPWEHAPWGYAKYFQLSKFYFSMLSVTSKHRQPKLCGSSLDFALRSAVKVGV